MAKDRLKLWVAIISSIVTFSLAVWSFSSASSAYNLLKDVKGDYQVHVDHWKSLPIINVSIVSSDEDCPSDWETSTYSPYDRNALQTIGRFPGSDPWCDCGDSGFQYSYYYYPDYCYCPSSTSTSTSACTTTQEDNGCYEITGPATATTEIWYTQSGYCHSNATLAGCADDEPADAVDLTLWRNNSKLCFKRGGWTAVERINALDISKGECIDGVMCQEAGVNVGSEPGNTICAPSEDECPIVDLGDLETAMSTGVLDVAYEGGNVSLSFPIIEVWTTIGSPCWDGLFGDFDRDNNERVSIAFDDDCDTDDTRFTEWDTVGEIALYQMNGVGTSGNNYMAGDGISSDSGSYSDIQYYDTYSSNEWSMYYRHEISWNSSCSAGDIHDLAIHIGPLSNVLEYQLALLWVNGIFGLTILGICLPGLMLMHAYKKDNDLPCIPGEGQEERDNIGKIQKTCGFVGKFAKMVPLVLCLVITDGISSFFSKAGEGDCSDSLTNASMADLGEQIVEVNSKNFQTLWIDLAMIIFSLLRFFLFVKKYGKAKEEEMVERELAIQAQKRREAEGGAPHVAVHNTAYATNPVGQMAAIQRTSTGPQPVVMMVPQGTQPQGMQPRGMQPVVYQTQQMPQQGGPQPVVYQQQGPQPVVYQQQGPQPVVYQQPQGQQGQPQPVVYQQPQVVYQQGVPQQGQPQQVLYQQAPPQGQGQMAYAQQPMNGQPPMDGQPVTQQ